MTERSAVESARQAASQGDWTSALEALAAADSLDGLAPADLILLGECAYGAGLLEDAFDAWEKAHGAAAREDDRITAAAAATKVAMHILIDTGLVAPIRGWLKRAERLLEGTGSTPVDAPLNVARAYERFYSGDFPGARRAATDAVEVGAEHGDVTAIAMARVAHARALIFEGDVDRGVSELEEVAISSTADDVESLTRGLIYCEIVCAWQGVAMYDVAERWTDEMERFSRRSSIGSVNGRCRIHRAEILRLRGECRDAEEEALAACRDLQPYMRREFGWPLTELGVIRLRMGDLDGAEEAFLAAHERGWEPQPGLALLRLAQGDVDAASSLIRDALEHPLDLLMKEWPPNNELRRAPLLEAQVEIAIAADDLDTARCASEELNGIAESYDSAALLAAGALAAGRVYLASGELPEATHAHRQAVHLWSEIGAPYETAVARMGLARAYREQGFHEGADLELSAARSAFERVCATGQAHAAERALRTEPSRARTRPQLYALYREGDFWVAVFDGEKTLLRDMKGLGHLALLLANPGREMHAVDLVAQQRSRDPDVHRKSDDDLSPTIGGDAGEILDERAKEVYRRRLSDIEEDIEEARTFRDIEREARAEAEREFVVRELKRAVGMGGRDRRAGATSERARAAVTRAIRNAMKRISEHHAPLGEHLDRTVRTGTYCSYMPDPHARIDWQLSP